MTEVRSHVDPQVFISNDNKKAYLRSWNEAKFDRDSLSNKFLIELIEDDEEE